MTADEATRIKPGDLLYDKDIDFYYLIIALTEESMWVVLTHPGEDQLAHFKQSGALGPRSEVEELYESYFLNYYYDLEKIK